MLPKNAHKEDAEFITEQLEKLSPQTRQKAIIGYDSVFEATYDQVEVEHKKMNAARRAANLRLREFIDKCARASMGYTEQPPIARD